MEDVYKKYGDIINLPRHEPDQNKHPRMSNYNRAAQFAPFAALTGFEEAVKESARLTNKQIELNDKQIKYLNETVTLLKEKINEQPKITVIYFQWDEKKLGGEYKTITDNLKSINEADKKINFTSGLSINASDIYSIEIEEKI